MNVTPAIAITKICHLTRSRGNQPDQPCIADQCMAWQWTIQEPAGPDAIGYCASGTEPHWNQGQIG